MFGIFFFLFLVVVAQVAAVAFQVTELKKQGIDLSKLVKAGVDLPPAPPVRKPDPVVAASAESTYETEDDAMVYGDDGPPVVPSRDGASLQGLLPVCAVLPLPLPLPCTSSSCRSCRSGCAARWC